MARTLRAAVLGVVVATLLAACEPTGDPRCDAQFDILDEIESYGWSIDCAPDFPNRGTRDGGKTWFPIWGWADESTQTVWIWPDEPHNAAYLRKLLWHELAHVSGIEDETDADTYSLCREAIDGVVYSGVWPTDADCERLGAPR